jgi:hypothetical protein
MTLPYESSTWSFSLQWERLTEGHDAQDFQKLTSKS